MSPHVDDRAAGVASLPQGDSERMAAYEHAASCDRCRNALDDAEELLSILREEPPLPGPSTQALRKAWNALASEMDDRQPVPAAPPVGKRSIGPAVAVLAALALSAWFANLDSAGNALAVRTGIECLLIEIVFGAVLLGSIRLVAPERRGVILYGALGAWGALAGQAYLHWRCPFAHEQAHIFVFHFGGVAVAAALATTVELLRERRHAPS